MHVDVDQRRIKRQRQHGHGITTLRDRLGIGTADRRQDLLVLHRASIDEGILVGGIAPVEGRHAGKARQPHILALGIELDRIILEVGAQHLGDARQMIIAGAGKFERRAVGA